MHKSRLSSRWSPQYSLKHVITYLFLPLGPLQSEIREKVEPCFDRFQLFFPPEVQISIPEDIWVKGKLSKCVSLCIQTSPSGPNCEEQWEEHVVALVEAALLPWVWSQGDGDVPQEGQRSSLQRLLASAACGADGSSSVCSTLVWAEWSVRACWQACARIQMHSVYTNKWTLCSRWQQQHKHMKCRFLTQEHRDSSSCWRGPKLPDVSTLVLNIWSAGGLGGLRNGPRSYRCLIHTV